MARTNIHRKLSQPPIKPISTQPRMPNSAAHRNMGFFLPRQSDTAPRTGPVRATSRVAAEAA